VDTASGIFPTDSADGLLAGTRWNCSPISLIGSTNGKIMKNEEPIFHRVRVDYCNETTPRTMNQQSEVYRKIKR